MGWGGAAKGGGSWPEQRFGRGYRRLPRQAAVVSARRLRVMDVMFIEFAFIDTFSALVDDGDMSTQQVVLCFEWQSSKHVLP